MDVDDDTIQLSKFLTRMSLLQESRQKEDGQYWPHAALHPSYIRRPHMKL